LVGFFYRFGIGTNIEYQRAFEMFSLAAANADINSNDFNNPSLMTMFYTQNKILGTISLGYLYLYGIGVEKNQKKAFQIFLEAAKEGSSLAESFLGYCCSEGYGVEKNEAKAFEYFQISAEKGNIVSLCDIAYSYQKGLGVQKDEKRGFELLLQAAEGGSLKAQNSLGICYENGNG
ncbi:10737_t:CDS:1, partial [Acaulospora morrowiae]